MRLISLATLAAVSTGILSAQVMTKAAAARDAAIYNGPRTKVSGFIWSDKYVYQAGQSLTLRSTVHTNGDLYPYTAFLYLVDNQTGEKLYWPALTTAPTDIFGNGPGSYAPMRVQDVEKQVIVGAGGAFPALTVPDAPGMHTIVSELRDYTGGRVLKANYMKFGVVTGTQTISQPITSDMTLTNDTEWHLDGIIFVKNGAVLTIEPGTFIIGNPPPALSGLVITREGTIEARGTASRPIIFTSSQPFGQRTRGDWLGLILLGKARSNLAAGVSEGNPEGEGYIEGLQTTDDGLYGGTDDTHYCGTLTYVRVEYAGYILSQGNEVNSFTFGGCGSKTVANHLQAIYGLDDTFEWFGGAMNAKYLVGGLSADDYLDWQLGFRGKVQFGVFYQSPDSYGNRGIEADNSEYNRLAEPFSNPTVANLTFIGPGVDGWDEGNPSGLHLRRGTRGSFNNVVVTRFFGNGLKLDDSETVLQATNGDLKVNGLMLWHNNIGGTPADTIAGNVPDADSAAFLNGTPAGGAVNVSAADPLLTRPFEYGDPDFTGMFASPMLRVGAVQMPDDGFFDQTANYLGAFGDVDWTKEWTSFLVEDQIAP